MYLSTIVRRFLTTLLLTCVPLSLLTLPHAHALEAPFTIYNAEHVEITIATKFEAGQHPTLAVMAATKQRLLDYVATLAPYAQAYSAYVATHTFDTYGEWTIEVKALYDSDVRPDLPSVPTLLRMYFDLEAFFHQDHILNAGCWYTGFSVGNHGGD